MSEVNNVTQTTNTLITNYDLSKFLLGNNHFIEGEFTASGDTDLKQGMVMGRDSSTGKLVTLNSAGSNGVKYPLGMCIIDQTVADGETARITLVKDGKVAKEKINFMDNNAEALDTVVDGRYVEDWLYDIGFQFDDAEELTEYDNQ